MSFLEKVFWDNSVRDYLIFFGFTAAGVGAGFLVNSVVKGKLKQWAEKTETKLDDLIIGILGGPVILVMTIIGISAGSKRLRPEGVGYVTASGEPAVSTGGFQSLVQNLYSATVYVLGTWVLFRIIDGLYQHYIAPILAKSKTKVDDLLVPLIIRGIKVALAIFVILLVLEKFGYGVGPIISFLLNFGLMLGFAVAISAIWVLRSAVAGLYIVLAKPFAEGDTIAASGVEGKIEKIEMTHTYLVTAKGDKIAVPNHELLVTNLKFGASVPEQPPVRSPLSSPPPKPSMPPPPSKPPVSGAG